jgi:hypothetical protein
MTTIRWLPRSLAYAAAILPLGLVSLVTAAGSPEGTARRWERLAAPSPGERGGAGARPTITRVIGHAVMSVLLGAVAWVLLLAIATMIARGALYGFFEPGPYDTSWGGPSRTGAWLAHFAIATPAAAVTVVLAGGVARLHANLTGRLQGAPTPGWVLPVALLLCAATALFVFAWTRQL